MVRVGCHSAAVAAHDARPRDMAPAMASAPVSFATFMKFLPGEPSVAADPYCEASVPQVLSIWYPTELANENQGQHYCPLRKPYSHALPNSTSHYDECAT